MSLIDLLQIILSLSVLSYLFCALFNAFIKNEFVSLHNIVLLFMIADVFVPAFIGAVTGRYLKYPYFDIQNNDVYFLSTLVFTVFLFLFETTWYLLKRRKTRFFVLDRPRLCEGRLLFCWLASIFVMLAYFGIEFRACGSWSAFYQFKISRVYLVTIEYQSILDRIVAICFDFAPTVIALCASIALANRRKFKRSLFWGFICPIVSFLFLFLTLYRGTIIAFFCMLILSIQPNGLFASLYKKRRFKRTALCVAAVAGFLFLVYGGYRTKLNNARWGEETSFFNSVVQMVVDTFGNSLVALARCLNYRIDGRPLFYGRSIFEMFYTFVPRALWVNKPEQYGVITLTTAMGSPQTTMDAVTMPGELIMNFSYFGLLMTPLIVIGFLAIEKMRDSPRFKYIYFSTIFSVVTASCWMSFTGFFAQVKYYIIYFIVCFFVFKERKHGFIAICCYERIQRKTIATSTRYRFDFKTDI